MRLWARIVLLVVLVAVGSAVGIGTALTHDASLHTGRIYPGVTIATVPVGGLTPEIARTVVQPVVDRRLRAPLTLRLADRVVIFTHGELGLRAHADEAVTAAYALSRTGSLWQRARMRFILARRGVNVALPFSHEAAALNHLLQGLAAELDAKPQDAEVAVEAGAVVLVTRSRPGQTLELAATAARIVAATEAGAAEADAVVTIVEPEFTTAEARELRSVLATFTTSMTANPNRIHNITLASGFVRGVVLPPDAVFSYNKVVGPRTLERGFKEAPVLVDDELVPGDGGGICQVSSTLFNVALLADFKILSRTNHSRPVAYLPLGRDATVVYGALDLIFKNTSGHHVLLWTAVRGRALTITAFGTPVEGQTVAVQVGGRTEVPPPAGTVTKQDPELDEGKVVAREAQPGYRAKTYRVVTVRGEVVRREFIASSFYRPVPRTIKIGTKTAASSEPRP